MAKVIKQATGADVRTWARETGVTVGARGRFSAEVQEQFNKANRGVMKYTPGNTKTIDLKVRVQSSSGKVRTETRPFPEATVRKAAGTAAKSRGPLSKAALVAAAETLSAPVQAMVVTVTEAE
jgi:hypothetical protein